MLQPPENELRENQTGDEAGRPASSAAEDHWAPVDPFDGRGKYEWKTRYAGAQLAIYAEAAYLFILFVLVFVGLFLAWHGTIARWLGVEAQDSAIFTKAIYVWLGGLLGGTTYAMKWLYHVVARGKWNSDRRLWRLFTPLLSTMLAFAICALLVSDLVGIFDQDRIRRAPALFAIAYLAGYFSDSTTAALARVAKELLGEDTSKKQ